MIDSIFVETKRSIAIVVIKKIHNPDTLLLIKSIPQLLSRLHACVVEQYSSTLLEQALVGLMGGYGLLFNRLVFGCCAGEDDGFKSKSMMLHTEGIWGSSRPKSVVAAI